MTFLETRGMLAKLLATENLIVEHDNAAQTASFNTESRVLTLPILKTENENVYNLFVAHECSHALYTPAQWADDIPNNVPFDFVNVVEDVRIEKLIQDKFPGLRTDFTRGYDKLNDDDFFGIQDKDLSKLNFIDRINLDAKLGARALVPFSDEEQPLVDAVNNCETFTDVLDVAVKLAEYIQAKRDNQQSLDCDLSSESGSNDTDGNGEQQTSQMKSDESDPNDEGDSNDQSDMADQDEISGTEASSNEFESETQNHMDEAMKHMIDKSSKKYAYVKPPTEGLDFIVDVDTLRGSFFKCNDDVMTYYRKQYDEYLKSIERDVNFMVQQFEMKKSADAYARTMVHKTGNLDMNNLHAYKLTEDLFLRQSVTPDGKNHGMIMYLDWSGSMDHICYDTVKQILMLVQFCRKVQIPFEVYTFTSGNNYDEGKDAYKDEYNGRVILRGVVKMVQVLTSTAKRTDLDQDMFYLWCQSRSVVSSIHLQMGGTPLDNALFALPDIVSRFRSNTNAQKVSFVCITDGESSPINVWEERTSPYDGEKWVRASSTWTSTAMIRDGSRVYPVEYDYCSTGRIVRWLETKIGDLTCTNIYLGGQAVCERYARNIKVEMDASDLKRNKSTVTTSKIGWPLITLMNPKGFGESQDEIEVESGAKKGQIRNALKKYLRSKQSNKVVLAALANQFS